MIGRTTTLALASRFFGHFLAVVARLQRESALLRVLCRRRRCLSTQIYLFFYVLYKLFFDVLVAIFVVVG